MHLHNIHNISVNLQTTVYYVEDDDREKMLCRDGVFLAFKDFPSSTHNVSIERGCDIEGRVFAIFNQFCSNFLAQKEEHKLFLDTAKKESEKGVGETVLHVHAVARYCFDNEECEILISDQLKI